MGQNIRIAAVSEHVPGTAISSDTLDNRFGKQPGWTRRHSGIDVRHWIAANETTVSMAASAARNALAQAGLVPGNLDCIVFAGTIPEQPIPCTAALIQRELGLGATGIPCLDINATCLGMLVSLDLMSMAIAAGRYQCVLVVASEVASIGLPWDEPETAMLFGDGAAAMILQPSSAPDSEVVATHFETFAEGADFCRIRGGGTRTRANLQRDPVAYADELIFRMDGPATYRLAAKRLPVFMQRLLGAAGVGVNDLAAIVPHQASAKALLHLQRAMRLPDGMVVNALPQRGNQMAASIGVALIHALEHGHAKRGDLIALVGSGAGLSFGGAVLRL